MKTNKLLKVFAVLSIAASVQSFASIAGSKHDLSPTGGGTIKSTATDEICVFCHTPHGSNSTFTGAPIWNKADSGAAYTTYGTTVAGTTADAAPNNPSKACLSCHDGVSAINSVINAPGSGSGTGTVAMAGGVSVMPAGATNIGTSLGNDHPISITYTEGNASLKATTTSIGGWTTPVGTAGTIGDILRNGKVECSTCHDPHLGPVAGTQELFLRSGTNKQSALCLGCHAK